MISRRLAVLFAVALLPLGALADERAERRPIDIVRELQQAQELTVQGHPDGARKVVDALARMTLLIENAPRDVWKNPRNLHALAVYLFSGGSHRLARVATSQLDMGPEGRRLVLGAIAFAEGKHTEAAGWLMELDPLGFPAHVGGHLALAQSALAGRGDPEAQLRHLARARLLMPGSVIEETALRRSVEIAMAASMAPEALFFIDQHQRRFARSAYAANFARRSRAILVKLLTSSSPEVARGAGAVAARSPESIRTLIITEAAHEALRAGSFQTLGVIARSALEFLPEGSRDANTARLYLAAAEILGPNYDDGLQHMAQVDPQQLDESHRRLLAAVRRLSGELRAWPPKAPAGAARPDGERTKVDATIARAESVLGEVGRRPGSPL